MRQWLANFVLSGQFVYWLAGLGLLLIFVLPDPLSGFLLGHGLFIAAGAFIGWLVLRMVRDARKWGLRRALYSYIVLPLGIGFLVFLSSVAISALSWLLGDDNAFQSGLAFLEELSFFLAFLMQDSRVQSGLLVGGGIHLFEVYRDRRHKQSVDYLAAIQLLRQFLHYYLKAWRLRPAKKAPFQHEWSASPEDVGEPTEDEIHPYLDLLPRRSLWQRFKSVFGRQ